MAAILFAIALLARAPFCTNDVFLSDAADYLRASHAGWVSLYGNTDSVSLTRFVDRYRSDASFRAHPWGLLYQENDGAALRHFHVPAGFYLPALALAAGCKPRIQRAIPATLSAATIALVMVVLGSAGTPIVITLPAGLFLCFSPVMLLAGSALSPHALFSLAAVACMFSFCRWLTSDRTGWLAAFALAFGLSIASLELSPLLALALPLTFLLSPSGLSLGPSRPPIPIAKIRRGVAGLLAAVCTAALVWPGGILRGGYLLSYGVFVFQGVFRSGVYFQERSLGGSIYRVGGGWVPGACLVILLAVAVVAAVRHRRDTLLTGFAILALLFFGQGLANGFRNPTYASHAVFAIVIAAALAGNAFIARALGAWRRPLTSLALVPLLALDASAIVGAIRLSPDSVMRDARRVAGVIALLEKRFPPGTAFVVNEDPQAFIANAPALRFYGAAGVSAVSPESWVRLDHYYLLVDTAAATQPRNIPMCDEGLRAEDFLVSCGPLWTGSPQHPHALENGRVAAMNFVRGDIFHGHATRR